MSRRQNFRWHWLSGGRGGSTPSAQSAFACFHFCTNSANASSVTSANSGGMMSSVEDAVPRFPALRFGPACKVGRAAPRMPARAARASVPSLLSALLRPLEKKPAEAPSVGTWLPVAPAGVPPPGGGSALSPCKQVAVRSSSLLAASTAFELTSRPSSFARRSSVTRLDSPSRALTCLCASLSSSDHLSADRYLCCNDSILSSDPAPNVCTKFSM